VAGSPHAADHDLRQVSASGDEHERSCLVRCFLPRKRRPLFYVETLADLEKEVAACKQPEDVVGMRAEKTPSGAVPNVYHRHLIEAELSGYRVSGQAMIGAGNVKQTPDGSEYLSPRQTSPLLAPKRADRGPRGFPLQTGEGHAPVGRVTAGQHGCYFGHVVR
jgi:hypothetical protein